jgi:hypothetical protein
MTRLDGFTNWLHNLIMDEGHLGDDAEQKVLCNNGLPLEVEVIFHPRGFY